VKVKKLVYGVVVSLTLLAGCSGEMAASSSEEIISNVLDSEKKFEPYYAKAVMKHYEGKELMGEIDIEEFAGTNGKRKIITNDKLKDNAAGYAVNDGEKILSYEEGSDVAYQMDISKEELPSTMTQKEQLTMLLEGIKETHDVEMAGEEKILGFDTYHLKVKAKSKDAILGDMEYWVDQKTWFVLKSITTTGDIRSEMEYTEIQFSPDFTDDTFTLELPENVAMKNMEDEFQSQTGTVEEAVKAFGKSFLLLAEKDAEIEHIEWYELKGEINRTEVTVYYKKDGIPSLMLSVFPTPEEPGMEIKESEVKVRGQNTEIMKEINSISWDENGIRYSIIIQHPDLTVEEAIALTENMIMSK